MKRVTVGMPVYNAMPYLPEAVQSILDQTWTDFHFLIINDGSTDGSAEYLDTLTDPRITVIHQENRGSGRTAQRILDLCDTEYLARMDADDVSSPQRLETEVAYLDAHPDVVLVATQVRFLVGAQTIPGPPLPTAHDAIVSRLLQRQPVISQPAMMVRTEAAHRAGGYRIRNAGQDFDFFLRTAEVGAVVNLEDAHHHYRIRHDSLVSSNYAEAQCLIAYAVDCALRRRRGEAEQPQDVFIHQWHKRPLYRKLKTWAEHRAAVHYRKALLAKAAGARAQPFFHWFAGALMRPARALDRIRTRIQTLATAKGETRQC